MNKVILIGRISYIGQTEKATRFNLAVDRRFKKEGEATADFIQCVAFGKTKEFIDKYFTKGMRMALEGRIQTGAYVKDGQTIYTTDIITEAVEFCESKKEGPVNNAVDAMDDEGLPFN